MTFPQACLLFLAALVAGAINSVAGGGSFLTLPALIFAGVAPITANTTSTVALWPGSAASIGAYRAELGANRRQFLLLGAISLLGGLGGAFVLLGTPGATFLYILPFLLLAATLFFAFGGRASAWVRARSAGADMPPWLRVVGTSALQFVISLYGGYFGGGIGILMLALLALMGMTNIHEMNALKTVLATCINGIATIIFIVLQRVSWPQALVMIVGAIAGGYLGAAYARKLDPALVRRVVIAIGFVMTAIFFIRQYVL